jgi:hypothetical protein
MTGAIVEFTHTIAPGVLHEYHGKEIDSLLYKALYVALYTPDV